MAVSSEYADLAWIPPASWRSGRGGRLPTLIVIHTTEGSEGTSSAENGALYDQRRTDGTSTHYFHDENSTVQCVRTEDTAHTAGPSGNVRGIQHELCGKAGQSPTHWADQASEGTIRQAAKQCARDALRWNIPVVKLSATQVRNGQSGFCGHVDVTYAWGEVDHTDPGPNFPWVKFLDMVQAEIDALTGDVEDEEDEMAGVLEFYKDGDLGPGVSQTHSGGVERAKFYRYLQRMEAAQIEANRQIAELTQAVQALADALKNNTAD